MFAVFQLLASLCVIFFILYTFFMSFFMSLTIRISRLIFSCEWFLSNVTQIMPITFQQLCLGSCFVQYCVFCGHLKKRSCGLWNPWFWIHCAFMQALVEAVFRKMCWIWCIWASVWTCLKWLLTGNRFASVWCQSCYCSVYVLLNNDIYFCYVLFVCNHLETFYMKYIKLP